MSCCIESKVTLKCYTVMFSDIPFVESEVEPDGVYINQIRLQWWQDFTQWLTSLSHNGGNQACFRRTTPAVTDRDRELCQLPALHYVDQQQLWGNITIKIFGLPITYIIQVLTGAKCGRQNNWLLQLYHCIIGLLEQTKLGLKGNRESKHFTYR